MPCCFVTSLLSHNLVKVNYLNHIIFTGASTLFSFALYYLFYFVVWDTNGRAIVITHVLLPSFVATIITAPLIFCLTRFISSKFGLEQKEELDEAVDTAVDKANEERRKRKTIHLKKNKYIKKIDKENEKNKPE